MDSVGITLLRRLSWCGTATQIGLCEPDVSADGSTPIIHAAALRPWGKELRWAWPRDGRRETLEGAGIASLRKTKRGIEHAVRKHRIRLRDGQKSVWVEAG